MQNELINESSVLTSLSNEIESLLEDIFLSGFHSIQNGTMEKLNALFQTLTLYGMEEGCSLLTHLKEQLSKYKDSFQADLSEAMDAYCQVEFYLEHIKSYTMDS